MEFFFLIWKQTKKIRNKIDDDDESTPNEFATYTGLQTMSGTKTTSGIRKRGSTTTQQEEQPKRKEESTFIIESNSEDIPLKSKKWQPPMKNRFFKGNNLRATVIWWMRIIKIVDRFKKHW